MKTRSALLFFIIILLFHSCITKGKHTRGNPPADRILTINFYPFWGGSSEALLERKKGVSNLYSTYHLKVNGVDTVLTKSTFINESTADSIYELAENVLWNADANHGTAETRVGLRFNMSFKKGRFTKSVSWENLKNANELPPDILSVIKIVNRICPDDFKIY